MTGAWRSRTVTETWRGLVGAEACGCCCAVNEEYGDRVGGEMDEVDRLGGVGRAVIGRRTRDVGVVGRVYSVENLAGGCEC